jgi:hypothetical protein
VRRVDVVSPESVEGRSLPGEPVTAQQCLVPGVADPWSERLSWIDLAQATSLSDVAGRAEGEVGSVPRTATATGTGRATGLSLAAILLVLACFAAMVVLHVVRTDLDPVRQVMSEYANGRFGWFMTAAFYAVGLGCVALALRLGRGMPRRRLSLVVRAVLVLGGLGLILAGVFEVERPAVPDTIEEVIHSDATLTAFTLIITAMLLFAVLCRWDPRWHDFRATATVLAVVAAAAGAFSPFAGRTTWSGLAQRILGVTVVAWLLFCALHIRFGGLRRSPQTARDLPTEELGRRREPP